MFCTLTFRVISSSASQPYFSIPHRFFCFSLTSFLSSGEESEAASRQTMEDQQHLLFELQKRSHELEEQLAEVCPTDDTLFSFSLFLCLTSNSISSLLFLSLSVFVLFLFFLVVFACSFCVIINPAFLLLLCFHHLRFARLCHPEPLNVSATNRSWNQCVFN